ncbi:MAG: S-methyl-5-thioribose-1-phosphate isomerase [Methanomassiliicoccus sp.]|nr:S-methyl-5-thioribose-1-phosphate isomerase [Methanomassiliicoccus sp.]
MRVKKGKRSIEARAVWFENGMVRMIDQRLIPQRFKVLDMGDHFQVAEAIRNMTVRGAPSIGAAAAYGMALAARNGVDLGEAANTLRGTRPTAYDLFYAVDHMVNSLELGDDPVKAADGYADQVVERCRLIGKHGAELIEDEQKIMTHCNAGALATVDIGTALAPIRAAWNEGRHIYVYVSETRPRLQGMRLTAWELYNEGIPHSIVVDGAAGHFLRKDVNMVIVGADRIAANGDFANKIGTFDKAVLCNELAVPFYVAAPISTFDFSIPGGNDIVIEDRSEDEVIRVGRERLAPKGSTALNPSFDMTPAKYVTGFITEVGILRPAEIDRVRREKFAGEGDL